MKRILVPINHEDGSLDAIAVASRLASAFSALVEVVHVRETRGAPDAEAQLADAQRRLGAAGVEHTIIRMEGGRVGAKLALAAESVDLVVMRNHAHRTADDDTALVTSTTLDLLRQASRPVLVVTGSATALNNPLFAYNGSPQSRRAIGSALNMLAPEVVKRGTLVVITSDEHMAERLFMEIDEMAYNKGVHLQHFWAPGRPAHHMLEQVESRSCDMIVMGAQGRSWFQEKIFGSTTNQMLRKSNVPVWLSV